MSDYRGGDSDNETSGENLESSLSSASSRRSSFGCFSVDLTISPPWPEKKNIRRNFQIVHQIGGGDIGKVYLCQLRGSEECYAMKVVDKEVVAMKGKSERAEMEKKVLKMVDHPFLPRLLAHFEDCRFSSMVMEYCPGGDLHKLRHRQPQKRFPLCSVRFYAAEVLIALEYLHMLGIIYRDLKPENVLVRSDGHIMLADFDLSLCSGETKPFLLRSPVSSLASTPPPATRFCFPSRLFLSAKVRTVSSPPRFVAEPVNARSGSFVGTHEYVAPEVASGGAHGSAVDWWALGVFIYEMIYGRTPFCGGASTNATLRNIIQERVIFPNGVAEGEGEMHARDLIAGLLEKNPGARLGSKRGAGEVKGHPFFKGVNFALIRSVDPPVVPGPGVRKTASYGRRNSNLRTTSFECF